MNVPAEFDVFDCSLDGINLIEASAGTGKTWNICGLYLRLLLERGLDVQQILVVTFTNAATAELRERIRSRIVETLAWLRDGDAGRRARRPVRPRRWSPRSSGARGIDRAQLALTLDQALQYFDEAAIFTIHGFCQRALADASFSAGLPFTLELVTDDSEMAMEAVHDFWRRRVADDGCPPALAALPAGAQGHARRNTPSCCARSLAQAAGDDACGRRASIGRRPIDTAALAAAYDAARATWDRAARRDRRAASTRRCRRSTRARTRQRRSTRAAAEWDACFREAAAARADRCRKRKLESAVGDHC